MKSTFDQIAEANNCMKEQGTDPKTQQLIFDESGSVMGWVEKQNTQKTDNAPQLLH